MSLRLRGVHSSAESQRSGVRAHSWSDGTCIKHRLGGLDKRAASRRSRASRHERASWRELR